MSAGGRQTKTIVEAAYPNAVLADSPLAYYRLDDTGSTLTDSSSNALNGSYGSSITHGAGSLVSTNSDAAATFPGGAFSAGGIATVAKNTTLQPSSVTVEGWVKESAANSGGFIDVISYGPQSGGQAWSVQITPSNTFSFYVLTPSSYAYAAGVTVLSAGTTYHVTGTYDGTTARLYVNGVQEATAAGSGAVNYGSVGTTGLSIGAGQSTSRNVFNGTLDDVSIYGSALAASRVQAHYGAGTTTPTSTGDPYATTVMGDSPAAYYRLDDAATAMADATTHHLNGTYGSSTTRHAAGLVAGTTDFATTFSGSATGTTTTAQAGQSTTLQPASVSVEAWIKESSTPSGFIDLVSYGDQHGQGYSLQLDTSNHAAFFATTSGGAGYVYAGGTTALSTGTIYHLVGTYDGTTAKIYVNGSLAASATGTGSISYSGIGTYGLSIGGGQNSTRNTLPGTIDEVAVYPSVLSATQVSTHYSKGAASTSGPAHVPNWSYACDSGQNCVSDFDNGTDDAWMATHFDWNEVDYKNSEDSTGKNLAAAGAKHIVIYVDPNITYYCAIPSGSSATSGDFPESGANCGGQVAGFLTAQSGSYAHAYLHQSNGNRLFNRADGVTSTDGSGQQYVGEPLNIGDSDVQAAFAAATAQNPYATDVFEDDAGGAYNCIYDYGRCDSTESFYTAEYWPNCTSDSYWCFKYGETAVEWDSQSNPQQAYANAAIALSNASAHNVIGNNGAMTNTYDLQWVGASKVEGAMVEGPWSTDATKWVKSADAILNYHNRSKYVVEGSEDQTQLLLQLASHWMVYDPTYSIESLFEVNPATTHQWSNDTTFPEETVVPSSPRVATPSNNDVNTFQTSTAGLYVREYATCYQAGTSIGRCAAIVNTNSTSKTITGLSFSYGHVLVPNTSRTWAAGGTAQWSTSVPTTIGATTGVILSQ